MSASAPGTRARTDTGPQAPPQRGRLRLRSRRSSRSPTGWAAPRPARSPRRSPRRRSTRERRRTAAASGGVAELIQEANRRVHERAIDRRRRLGHGHDDDGRARRARRPRRVRPRRRLARLPAARRQARAADRRPLARRRARAPRRAVARRGGGAPAALGDHARARHRPGRRRRHVLDRGASRATSSCSARDGLSYDRRRRRRSSRSSSSTARDLDGAAQALVQAANRAGGEDNITAVLFELVEGDGAADEPDERTREYRGACRRRRGHAPPGGRRRAAAADAGSGRHDGRLRRRDVQAALAQRHEPGGARRRAAAAAARAPRDRRRWSLVIVAARLVGARPLRRHDRNRELVYLVVVGDPDRPRLRVRLHRAAGRVVSWGSLGYARLLLRALPRRARRRARPCRTPTRTCCRWRGC